ncbi:MAG: zf-HC2 domain-containing protein [Candidatus Edwardsbacteria bacterium]|jgi:hypothetical protein|nr:zf-HC2 domain-containing protein [Candidatus Edwardsbacteria bacterium]
MNCIEQKQKISELVDGALPAAEADALRTHLRRCPGCRREYRLQRMVADAVAGLPQYRPGREFNDRILLALGHQPVRLRLTAWVKWSIAASACAGLAWTGLVAYALASRLSLVGALRALQLAAHPQETLSALGLSLVKLGFAAGDVLAFLFKAASWTLRGSSLPLQVGIAAVIACTLVSLLSRRAPAATN